MKVGIVVASGPGAIAVQDVLHAEYLAAAVRMARHEPRCIHLRQPIDPAYYQSLLADIQPHFLLYYCSPASEDVVGSLTELAYAQDRRRPQFLLGPMATLTPEAMVKVGPINGLLRGEPDMTLRRLLNALADRAELKKVPGLVLRRLSGPAHEVPMGPMPAADQLPVPDFQGFNWPQIAGLCQGAVPVEASRGSQCHSLFHLSEDLARAHGQSENQHRVRPVADVIRDIQTLRMRIDPLRLDFIDEVFPSHDDWIAEFTQAYRAEVGLPFSARLSSWHHPPRTVESLVQAGLSRVCLEIETGDPTFRYRFSNTHPDNRLIADLVATATELGCLVNLNVMLGLPEETVEHLDATLKLLQSLPFDAVQVVPFKPVAGTAIHAECEKLGLLRKSPLGTRDALIRTSQKEMEVGRFAEAIHRLNLERQTRHCHSERGYFSFVEHCAHARHRIRQFHSLQITRRRGQPSIMMAVPAESTYLCFLQPNSEFLCEVELMQPQGAPEGSRVHVEVVFHPENGGDLRIFSGRLRIGSEHPAVLTIREPLSVGEPLRGQMIFTARDAGGGDGLHIAWIDPVLDHPKARRASGLHLRPGPITAPPQPLPEFLDSSEPKAAKPMRSQTPLPDAESDLGIEADPFDEIPTSRRKGTPAPVIAPPPAPAAAAPAARPAIGTAAALAEVDRLRAQLEERQRDIDQLRLRVAKAEALVDRLQERLRKLGSDLDTRF